WLESHFNWQIKTFWYALAGLFIGFLLLIILVGGLIMLATTIWMIYRIVKGWLAFNDGKELPDAFLQAALRPSPRGRSPPAAPWQGGVCGPQLRRSRRRAGHPSPRGAPAVHQAGHGDGGLCRPAAAGGAPGQPPLRDRDDPAYRPSPVLLRCGGGRGGHRRYRGRPRPHPAGYPEPPQGPGPPLGAGQGL